MEAIKRTYKDRSVQTNLSTNFRMLDYASSCDSNEITRVHDFIKSSSDRLSLLEKKYNITDFNQSKNMKNFPKHERGNVLRLWSEVYQGAMELDFLFIDEDLYPYNY